MAGSRWRTAALAAFLLAYFVYFEWDALGVHFASDELFSMWHYWHGPRQMLAAQFQFWQYYFRPAVGLFYVPIFVRYGLDPVPYHVVLLVLLALGAVQVYRFARVLGAGELAAAFAALVACYHAGLGPLYFSTSFIADTLCCLFYLTTFVYYARIRESKRVPNAWQTAGCAALYLCALNSKETAASLPLLLLAYEWIYHGRPVARWSELLRWARGPGRVIVCAGLLNLFFLYTRVFAPNSLSRQPGYRLVYSRARIVDFQSKSLADLFLVFHPFHWGWVLGIWIVLTYLAFRRRNTVLRFCWFYLLLAPLAIEFAENRHGANLYTLLPGWAVFVSVVASDLIREASGFLSKEPLFDRLSRPALTAMLACLVGTAWARENRFLKETQIRQDMVNVSPDHWDVMQQLRALHPRIRPGSKVVFLDDPLPGFDMALIAELTLQDRSVEVRLNRVTPLPPEQIAAADALFTFDRGKLLQLR